MTQDVELLTPEEVAERLRTSVESVRRWARAGQLRSVRLPGGQRRFRTADVDALLAGEGAA